MNGHLRGFKCKASCGKQLGCQGSSPGAFEAGKSTGRGGTLGGFGLEVLRNLDFIFNQSQGKRGGLCLTCL